jgi:16S rRNA G966 N2-methylase RsmD
VNRFATPGTEPAALPPPRASGDGALFPDLPLPAARASNRLAPEDRPIHDWYRFVLAFPPHLVRDYLGRFGVDPGQTVLDPFCGTGTTVVEAMKQGCAVVGFEANPMPHLACRAKTDWAVDPAALREAAEATAAAARDLAAGDELRRLPDDAASLLLDNSICPRPLHRTLALNDAIESGVDERLRDHARVALASAVVHSASNLHFGPEVGVRGRRGDADVVSAWLARVRVMAGDLETLAPLRPHPRAAIHRHDAREALGELAPGSIDAVFTSPPYPNEKDYTRTTRLESVLLGLVNNKAELRAVKRRLVKSNTRGVYKTDDDETLVTGNERIEALCAEIERRRVAMGKTSGFERLYARVTRLYFGGMVRQLAALRPALRPGAMLGYVVGDQASYLQVLIRTGEILAELAEALGYEVVGLDLFRERFATATKAMVREEVLVLRWPG